MKSKLFLFVLLYFFSFGCKAKKNLDNFTKDSPEFKGQDVFIRMACDACHSIDGSLKLGPTIKAQYGTNVRHTDGTVMKIDDNYICDFEAIQSNYISISPIKVDMTSYNDISILNKWIKE